MYSGFDVYLADTAGLLLREGELDGYTELMDHETYGPRMRHATRCFAGRSCVEYPFERAPLYAELCPEPGGAGPAGRAAR
ncbi:hypothetical protein P9869_26220 [Streptomyces ossamyceticus]|nr:hypothetical protein [Streptomyces ossamyceticus]